MTRRTQPLPPGWSTTRRRILTRDNHTCQQCGTPAREVDHIIGASQGGGDDDHNLISLCPPCHQAKTQAEARAGYRRWQKNKPTRTRPPEPHPGLRGGG